MSNYIDLTGKKFGRLTVLERDYRKGNKYTYWKCCCDCGNEAVARAEYLKTGRTKSCGCLRKETTRKHHPVKHGLSHTRLYHTWDKMIKRCTSEKFINYENYGGRGITVCQEWLDDFMNFYNWAMANGYRDDLTLDRIKSNGNYEPSNCRWVTQKIQQNNRRDNHILELNGEKHTISEWSEIVGIKRGTIERRINKYGWTEKEALTIEPKIGKRKPK